MGLEFPWPSCRRWEKRECTEQFPRRTWQAWPPRPVSGRRTAGRIILELKGALEAREDASIVVETDLDGEVMAALTALGYSPSEARQAVGNVEKDGQLTLEDRIRFGASAIRRRDLTGGPMALYRSVV